MSVTRIGRALDPHEMAYLEAVSAHLDDLPPEIHTELMNEAVEHLAERPRSRGMAELVAPLGPPESYAAALRADRPVDASAGEMVATADHAMAAGVGPETARPRRWTRRRRWAFGALAVLVVGAMVGGAFGYDWWVTWQAPIEIPMQGINRVGPDTMRGISFAHAGDTQEIRVQAMPGDRFVAILGLYGRSGGTLTGIELFGPELNLLHTTSVEVADNAVYDAPGGAESPAAWHPFHPAPLDDPRMVDLRVYFTYQPCVGEEDGGGVSYSTIRVTYRARGRTRHEDVSLGEWITFEVHDASGPPTSTQLAGAGLC